MQLSSKSYTNIRWVNNIIYFVLFRKLLEIKLLNINKKNKAGAKPYDVVILFKILILQRYYGLGDNQILDRTSWVKSFLGLSTGDKVPDEKTIWSFRERVTKQGLVEELFRYEQIKRLKIIY